jgi:hypothetical protein
MNHFRVQVLFPAMLAVSLFAQQQPAPSALPSGSQADAEATPTATPSAQAVQPPGGNRVFGVLPNYRTADASQESTVAAGSPKTQHRQQGFVRLSARADGRGVRGVGAVDRT